MSAMQQEFSKLSSEVAEIRDCCVSHQTRDKSKTMTLNSGLRRDFTWRFFVADVTKPIIGADFLAFYKLLVDVKNRSLIDKETNITFTEKVLFTITL